MKTIQNTIAFYERGKNPKYLWTYLTLMKGMQQ
jgi:hypothetical protein